MTIVFCNGCGFIGNDTELLNVSADSLQNNRVYDVLIKINGFSCRCCPKCKSSEIFYKFTPILTPSIGQEQINVPSVFWPQGTGDVVQRCDNGVQGNVDTTTDDTEKPSNDDVTKEILKEIFDSISSPVSPTSPEVAKKKGNTKEKKKPNRLIDTKSRYSCVCDTCNKKFETKVDGTVKCPECLKKLIG